MERSSLANFALVCALALTSCGGGGGGGGGNNPPAPPPPPAPTASAQIAVTNVTVIPMDGSGPQPDYTVRVNNGRIVEMGPTASTDADATTVINANGQYLLPGMADMHVHVYNDNELPLFVANGVTTVRNMWGVPATLQLRQRVNSGQTVGPTIVTSGPIIDGNPPFRQGTAVAETAAEGRALVREQIQDGYDFIKIYTRLNAQSTNAIIDESRLAGVRVAGHAPRSLSYQEVIESTIWSVEHLDGFLGAIANPSSGLSGGNFDADVFYDLLRDIRDGRRPFSDLYDPGLRRQFAELSAASDTAHVPTLTYWQNFYVPRSERTALLNRPEVRFVSPQIRDSWDIVNYSGLNALTEEQIELRRLQHEEDFRIVADLFDAGNEILVGTDSLNPYIVFGFAIHDELMLLVRAGLTPYEAMAAATANAARFLDQEDEFGTIAVGLRADLVLYSADPTADIANSRMQAGVILRGQYFTRAQLDQQLETIAASF